MTNPVVDTNIVIDWLRRRQEAYVELSRYDVPRISRITWAEVLAGEPLATRSRVVHLLRRFEVIEVDAGIAAAAANIRHASRIKLLDALILATAQANGALLVTRNTKDFPDTMPGIRIPYSI